MSTTYQEIATRLSKFNPPIHIDKHIKRRTLEVAGTTLDGITFEPIDREKLLAAIRKAKDSTGMKVFKGKTIDNKEHWALKLSFAATDGEGFRQAWAFPPLPRLQLSSTGPFADRHAEQAAQRHSANFGDSVTLPDLSSLHVGMGDKKCNIHIDKAGFVLQGADKNVSLTPDFWQHLIDELVFKTNLKSIAPDWAKPAFDRVSLIYPSAANGYSRMGPRLRQVPLLREVGRLPGVGPILSKVPLPGVQIDLTQVRKMKLKATVSCGLNGSCSTALTFGGPTDFLGG